MIDAWLSVQSMVGIMSPSNALGWVAVAIVGVGMTVLAVLTPLFLEQHQNLPVKIGWWAITIGDAATSIIGMIWYGVMGNPLSQSVDFHRISFNPGNTLNTLLNLAFVAALFVGCIQLGRSLDYFRKQ